MKCFFVSLIWILVLHVSRINGEDVTDDVSISTMSIEDETTPMAEPPPSRFQFSKDRQPPSITTRIIGGYQASAHQYPFQVALYVQALTGSYFCGGSLIAEEWVLTAAHCVDVALSVEVILGAHNLNRMEDSQVSQTSSTFFIHENWDIDLLQNDIALIKLPEKNPLNNYTNLLEISKGSDSYAGLIGRCLGWGRTILGSLSSVLRYVDAEIISNDNCNSYDDYTGIIVERHLCTSGAGFVGSCNGDSGGPLIANGVQVGIVSFGVTNCSAGLPSVYTRVSEYSSWITRTMENAVDYVDDKATDPQINSEVNGDLQGSGSSNSLGINKSSIGVFVTWIIAALLVLNYL